MSNIGGHIGTWSEEIGHPQKLRYPDGCYISRHPNKEEIYAHYAFWFAQCSTEQAKVLEAMRDMQIMKQYRQGPPPIKSLSPEEAVERAIKFWIEYYPLEVNDFMTYIDLQKQGAINQKGFDKSKNLKLMGAIPVPINHMLKIYNPEMVMTLPGDRYPRGHKIFYKLFTKANIGGM